MTEATRADVCAVAVAECFRGDGEIMVSPMGVTPTLGARLAKATFEPDLVLTDGMNLIVSAVLPLGEAPSDAEVEGWMPFPRVFDTLWWGKRHVMMGASQIDRFGNQNIACIGDFHRPKAQLLGVRGAPGNTINHATSYWVPRHSARVFVERVDVVCGVGYDRAAALPAPSRVGHEIRRVVTDLAVLDFETPDHRMRVRSVHPGVTLDEVREATGFELVADGEVPTTRLPTAAEIEVLRRLDPKGHATKEVQS
ncbi:MAG: hypothetical protein KC543_16710 [Myxococcales bacterium]|nr:hypothetical protein [Myxococcales bacterium]